MMAHEGTGCLLASRGSFYGAAEPTNALQGPPQQPENITNTDVRARCAIFGKAARLIHSLAKLGLLLTRTCPLLTPWQGRRDSKMSTKVIHGAKT